MDTPTSSSQSRKQSSISCIKQTNDSIPQEVKDLYGKSSTTRQKLWKQKPDPSANRIVNYFRKKNDERSSTFDTNRQPTLNTNFNAVNPIKSLSENEEFKKSQIASAEAKATAIEINSAMDKKGVNQADLIKMNTQMVLQMHKAHELLTSAVVKRDSEMINQFSLKLNEATDYVSKELNIMRKEIDEIKSSDDVEKLATMTACKDDLKKLWIRFTYVDDINQYREEKNPPMVAKKILNQLNINLNKIMWPIEAASFKIKKFSYDQLPETALECIFINSTIADKVKHSIINFNNGLERSGMANMIRYRVATDWSYQVRKLLKYCNEMRRCGTFSKVVITNNGIKVFHKEIKRTYLTGKSLAENSVENSDQSSKTASSIVNSTKELESLRALLQDFNFHVPVTEVYNQEYFEKPLEERIRLRNEFLEEVVINEEQEMERTISDCSFSSIQERDK